MQRMILGVIAGAVGGGVVMLLIEMLGHKAYPPPADLNPAIPEQMKEIIAQAPVGALAFVLLAWSLASFAGGIICSHLAPVWKKEATLVMALVLMIGGFSTFFAVPHPPWMIGLSFFCFIPMAYLGYWMQGRMSR